MSVLGERRPHVVLVVANIPVDRDRRVLREAAALLEAGADVTVVCPQDGPEVPVAPGLPDICVAAYRRPVEGAGLLGFAAEFGWALLRTASLLRQVDARQHVDAVQFCNPPDVFFPLMALLRRRGRWVVFDHHDLSPEVYGARSERPSRLLLWLLRRMERLSLRAADRVVSTNTSFRDVAVRRGGVSADLVTVVRNGPRLGELPARPVGGPGEELVVYVGTFGRQDGVELFVQMAALVHARRPATRFVAVGDGETMPELRKLSSQLGLHGVLRLTGWVSGAQVHEQLSEATLAVQPDPRNRMNELSTMAKTVEYLAHGLPVVAVDLLETRRTAGRAAVYVREAQPALLADAVVALLEDPDRRARMGVEGRRRVRRSLAWDHQVPGYLAAFAEGPGLLSRLGLRQVRVPEQAAPVPTAVQS